MNITKTAMITVCGRPNVGKSSLTNALVGEKIAIVSDKPQTTRNRIYGVVNREDTQFVLLDTPGLHKPRSRLGDYMVKVVRESLQQVEAALLLVEPIAHVGEPEKILLQRITEEGLPCVLCINKIDTVEKKDDLLEVIAAYSAVYPGFDAIIPISARTGDGLDDLMAQLRIYATAGPQLFPDGMTTDQPDRQVVGEIVREKLLRNLLTVSMRKNLSLSQRIFCTTPKTVRGRLLTYFSAQAARSGSLQFEIPFNRQQLADYLNCDRSALSRELSLMQKDGLLDTFKSSFKLLDPDALKQMVQ